MLDRDQARRHVDQGVRDRKRADPAQAGGGERVVRGQQVLRETAAKAAKRSATV